MSQKINHKLRDKEWRPARSVGGSTTQFRWLVINLLSKNQPEKEKEKVLMDRGHSRTFVGTALATGLVGLVTLPATPTGHRPPALWNKPRNSVQSRRSIRSLRSSRDEVREGLRSIKSSKNT